MKWQKKRFECVIFNILEISVWFNICCWQRWLVIAVSFPFGIISTFILTCIIVKQLFQFSSINSYQTPSWVKPLFKLWKLQLLVFVQFQTDQQENIWIISTTRSCCILLAFWVNCYLNNYSWQWKLIIVVEWTWPSQEWISYRDFFWSAT